MVVRNARRPESARRAVEQAVEAVAPDQASIASEQDVLDRNFYPMRGAGVDLRVASPCWLCC